MWSDIPLLLRFAAVGLAEVEGGRRGRALAGEFMTWPPISSKSKEYGLTEAADRLAIALEQLIERRWVREWKSMAGVWGGLAANCRLHGQIGDTDKIAAFSGTIG
jgi:hypothetical protein